MITEEKVLLYTHSIELKTAKREALKAEKELNSYIAIVEQVTKLELSDKDKLKVKDDSFNYLEKTLKFSLPDAPEKLKYESIGVDVETIKKANTGSWKHFEFEQNSNGDFILSEFQPRFEAYKKYATEKQLKILDQTKGLCKALNTSLEQGLLTGNIVKVREAFKSIKIDNRTNTFEPCLQTISSMG